MVPGVEPRSPKPRVLVVDENPRRRLLVVAALAPRFDVHPLPAGEDPLRTARGRRPELVLFALDRANADDTLRFCRTLRTDVRPIEHVAVYADGRPPRPAEVVTEAWRADGYLAGAFGGDEVLAFAEAVLRGERPVRLPATSDGVLSRLRDRLRLR